LKAAGYDMAEAVSKTTTTRCAAFRTSLGLLGDSNSQGFRELDTKPDCVKTAIGLHNHLSIYNARLGT